MSCNKNVVNISSLGDGCYTAVESCGGPLGAGISMKRLWWVGANRDMACVDIRGAQRICMGGDTVNVSDVEEKNGEKWEKRGTELKDEETQGW